MTVSSWLSNLFQTSPTVGATPISPPPAQSVQPLPVTVAGQTIYPTNNPAPGTAPNYSSTAPSSAPSLSALLGGLQSAGSAMGGGGSQAPQPPQMNIGTGVQNNTAQLAAYKPMNFAGKAMVPPQIMQALMMMGQR